MRCIVINNEKIPTNEKKLIIDTWQLKIDELNSNADLEINDERIIIDEVNEEVHEMLVCTMEFLIDMLPVTRTLNLM